MFCRKQQGGKEYTLYKKISYLFILLILVSACAKWDAENSSYKVIYSSGDLLAEDKNNDSTEYTIAIVPKRMNIPYFSAVKEGAMEAGKDLGVNVIYKGPSVANPTEQIKIIEDLITHEKIDVLAVSANDPEALIPVLKKSQQKNILVITWDSDTNPEGRDYFINMVDPETLGRHLMDTLAWSISEEGEFAIMTGAYSAANLNEWLHWIKVQQEEYYPNMELVEVVANDDDPHQAYISAIELIQDYPQLKGIIGNSSVGPPAAAEAVQEAGKQGKIAVVGLSPPNPMKEYLKNGSAQIITLWSPKKLGYLTVVLATNSLMGIVPYDNQRISGVGEIRVKNDMVIMGEPIDFTQENVDQFDF